MPNLDTSSSSVSTMKAPFSPEDHLSEVLSRYAGAPTPRLAELTKAAIKHLHAFVREVKLTREEWFDIIDGLTRTGQMCDDNRQEFMLASDTLGVSMLVEMINHSTQRGATEPTVFGPFHQDNAPHRTMGDSIVDSPMENDEIVVFSGTVKDLDGKPISNASIDVWEVASNCRYDVQDTSNQPPMNMRGLFTTAEDGVYTFQGIRPVKYEIPGDGPAGELLFANGRHNWRPAHVHFVVSAPRYKRVITHLFDSNSEYLNSDAVFGVRESLIVDMNNGQCKYDFVLQPETAKSESETLENGGNHHLVGIKRG